MTVKDVFNKAKDMVNKPAHYHMGEIDVITFLIKFFPRLATVTVAEGFFIGNIIKYIGRHKDKNGLEDLYKARDYLNRLIQLEEEK